MGKKTLIATVLFLVAGMAFAQSVGPYWDYLRANNTPTAKWTVDTIKLHGAKHADTTCAFYFNDLVPYGTIWLKGWTSTAKTKIPMPRIQVAFISDAGVLGDNHYVPNDSVYTIERADSYLDTVGGIHVGNFGLLQQKWDTTFVKSEWYLFIDSVTIPVTASGDTVPRILTYDFRQWHPKGVRFRFDKAAVNTDSTNFRIFITGARPAVNRNTVQY